MPISQTCLPRRCAAPFRGLLIALTLSACTVGPHFERPQIHLPMRWKQRADVSDLPVPDEWWTLFRNRSLNGLIERALANNQDLQAALARVDAARALVGVDAADWFPQLGASASKTWEQLSQKSFGANLPPGFPLPDLTRRRYNAGFTLNWEIDLWGRVRRSVESARAQAASTEERLAALRLTVAAEVARNYFLAASLDNQMRVIQETIGLRGEAVGLQESRFKSGVANEMDVSRARTEMELARSDHAAIERQRGIVTHAIAVLCGEIPSTFELNAIRTLPEPPRIPAGMPGTVLLRRPDIRAAEQTLRSANAQIGVAKASFYPAFKLTGSGGLESIGAEDFLDWRSKVMSAGPSVTAPIFQGGRLRANLGAARARYDESLASYRQTILTALREVEDSLLDLRAYNKQRAAVAAALTSADETARLARVRYDKGLANYFEAVDADRIVLSTRLAMAQIDGQRLMASVALVKALGGGWNPPSWK